MLTVTSVADNAAVPTGFTVTVSGSGGAALTILTCHADTPFAGVQFQSVGSITGDGSLAVLCPPGFYFVTAMSSTAIATPVVGIVTDQLEAVGVRVQEFIASRLALIGLAGIGPNILTHFLPDSTEMRFPCAVVHWDGTTESEESGLNSLDYIAYPIRLDFYDTGFKGTQHDLRKMFMMWRQQVGRGFRHQPNGAVPELAWCDVQFGAAVNAAEAASGIYLGSLVIRAVCREPRGLGA